MSELDFFCYSLYVQNERKYESNWAFLFLRFVMINGYRKALEQKQ